MLRDELNKFHIYNKLYVVLQQWFSVCSHPVHNICYLNYVCNSREKIVIQFDLQAEFEFNKECCSLPTWSLYYFFQKVYTSILSNIIFCKILQRRE